MQFHFNIHARTFHSSRSLQRFRSNDHHIIRNPRCAWSSCFRILPRLIVSFRSCNDRPRLSLCFQCHVIATAIITDRSRTKLKLSLPKLFFPFSSMNILFISFSLSIALLFKRGKVFFRFVLHSFFFSFFLLTFFKSRNDFKSLSIEFFLRFLSLSRVSSDIGCRGSFDVTAGQLPFGTCFGHFTRAFSFPHSCHRNVSLLEHYRFISHLT